MQAAIQAAEVEALEAIFGEDFARTDTRKAWKGAAGAHNEFVIKVLPLEDDLKAGGVAISLHFRLPSGYPKVAPSMATEKAAGLSDAQVKALEAQLHDWAKELLGTELIFELCSRASAFITEHNSMVRNTHQTSLIEEMDAREAERQREAAAKAKSDAERQRRLEEEDRKRLAGLIEADRDRVRESVEQERAKKVGFAEPLPPIASTSARPPLLFERGLKIDSAVVAHLVIVGAKQADCAFGSTYSAEVVADDDDERWPATVHRFDLASPAYASMSGRKKLAKIEQDLLQLQRLRHDSLQAVYGCRIIELDDGRVGRRLEIVTEPQSSTTLADLLGAVDRFSDVAAIGFARQIAAGLDALHRHGITHRALALEHVVLGSQGSVQIIGATFLRWLADLNRSEPFSAQVLDGDADSWTAPEARNDPLSYSPSRDMFDVGVCIARMLHGSDVCRRVDISQLAAAGASRSLWLD